MTEKSVLSFHSNALSQSDHEVDQELAKKFKEASKHKLSIQDFISEFMSQFLSDSTKRSYLTDLAQFFQFVKKGGVIITHPNQIKVHHFQLYRDHMRERGLTSATINRRLVCLRSFMKWSLASKLIDHNPLEIVKLPKIQTETPTTAFDDEEVIRMIQTPDHKTKTGATHRLILVLLFNLGLRRSELVGLKLKNFFKERGHFALKIKGKGDKIRLLPLNSFVMSEIELYLDHLKTHHISLDPDDFLIQSQKKKKNTRPMDGSTVFKIVEKYAKICEINKKVSPHSCRATVISHLLDTQRTPIRDVAHFAGHSNITTTERYDKKRKGLDESAAYDVDYIEKKSS